MLIKDIALQLSLLRHLSPVDNSIGLSSNHKLNALWLRVHEVISLDSKAPGILENITLDAKRILAIIENYQSYISPNPIRSEFSNDSTLSSLVDLEGEN